MASRGSAPVDPHGATGATRLRRLAGSGLAMAVVAAAVAVLGAPVKWW